jgi:hypothetical protein
VAKRAHYAVMLSLLSACGEQPKVSWEYPVGSSPVRFQICHVAKGQTQEDCRRVENPKQQSQGDKVLYTVSLTRGESKADRIGVAACEGTCSAATWVSVDVK